MIDFLDSFELLVDFSTFSGINPSFQLIFSWHFGVLTGFFFSDFHDSWSCLRSFKWPYHCKTHCTLDIVFKDCSKRCLWFFWDSHGGRGIHELAFAFDLYIDRDPKVICIIGIISLITSRDCSLTIATSCSSLLVKFSNNLPLLLTRSLAQVIQFCWFFYVFSKNPIYYNLFSSFSP